ncbi:MAG: ABC transporter substrate-binding protein, partial [Rhizobiaceae bacterium]
RDLLAPYSDLISEDIIEGKWQPPISNGSGRDRKILRAALKLLSEAGYKQQGGKLVDVNGNPLSFEILTKSEDEEKLAIAYKRSLDLVGIEASIRAVDDAQYQRRTQDFDYDMIIATLRASLSPGNEQVNRWGSQSRDIPGTFNYAGAAEPAIDAAIDSLLNAKSSEEFQSSVRALDRLLIAGNYVVPLFHLSDQWIAKWNEVEHPEKAPIYGNQYPVWWSAQE